MNHEHHDPAGARRNLILASSAFFLCFAAWGMLAPIAPKLQDSLDLSDTQTAVMIAVPVILGSLLRIPLGYLTDRIGGRLMFVGMLAYVAVPPLLVGFAASYPMLLVAGFLLGVAGASFAIGVPFVSEWFPPGRQGWALGIYGVGTAGTAASAFAMPALVDGFGRATAGIVYAIALGAFALVWLSAARNAPVVHKPQVRYREVVRSGMTMWRLALFYFVTFGGFVAMSIYLPKLLRDWFDYSLTGAGLRTAGFVVIAAVIARPLGGWLADRIGGYRVLTVAFLGVGLDAIGLAWQAHDPRIVPVTLFSLSMAGFLGIGNGAVFKLVPHHFPQIKGAVTGIVGAAGGLGGFFPPLVMGIVKDATGTYVMGFVFLVAFAWMCAGQALMLADGDRVAARGGRRRPAEAGGADGPAGPPRPRVAEPTAARPLRSRVVVAGGGVAALEAVLTLEELAGDRVETVLLAPDPRFEYRPLSVAEPFGLGRAHRFELAELLEGRSVEIVADGLAVVDHKRRALQTAGGATLRYDALLVAVGARQRNALPGALCFAGRGAAPDVRRLLRNAEAGRIQRLAFAVPPGVGWVLPAYELALMASAELAERDAAVDLTLVTPEPRPVDAFGDRASRSVDEMLRLRRVAFRSGVPVRFEPGLLLLEDGDAILADAVVALPRAEARAIPGLPSDADGFLPVDEHCGVRGTERVYAAGDITDFPLKQGGLAAQQADAAAEAIAADLGCDVTPTPFRPVLRGLLLTGRAPSYLRAEVVSGRVTSSLADDEALWWPPAKIAGRRLAPFLALRGAPPGAPPGAVAVELAAEGDGSAA